MSKTTIFYAIYNFVVTVFLFLSIIFIGILADEGVDYKKIYPVYTFGFSYPYEFAYFLLILLLFISVITFFINAIISLSKLIKQP